MLPVLRTVLLLALFLVACRRPGDSDTDLTDTALTDTDGPVDEWTDLPRGELLWTRAGPGSGYPGTSDVCPAVREGYFYSSGRLTDFGGSCDINLAAVDATDGHMRWTIPQETALCGGTSSGELAIFNASEGTGMEARALAFNVVSRAIAWNIGLGRPQTNTVSPLAFGDSVFFPERVESSSGSVVWPFEPGFDAYSPITDGLQLFVVDTALGLRAVDIADGDVLWTLPRANLGRPFSNGSNIYTSVPASILVEHKDTFLAVSGVDGGPRWSRQELQDGELDGLEGYHPPWSWGVPDVADGMVYVVRIGQDSPDQVFSGYDYSAVAALDESTGDPQWVHRVNFGASVPARATIRNGQVLMASDRVYAFDASDGMPLWSVPVPNGQSSTCPPVFLGDLIVFYDWLWGLYAVLPPEQYR